MGGKQSTTSEEPVQFDDIREDYDLREGHTALKFHENHGRNIKLSADRKVAKRENSYDFGVTFSDRPIAIFEQVTLKVEEVNTLWTGSIRFGVTCHDPASEQSLPKHACPYLTERNGYWAEPLAFESSEENDKPTFIFFITADGILYVSKGNDQECHQLISGLPTDQELWAVIDVYGSTTSLKLLHTADSQQPAHLDALTDPGPSSAGTLPNPEPSYAEYAPMFEVMEQVNALFNIPVGRIRNDVHYFSSTHGDGVFLQDGACAYRSAREPEQNCLVFVEFPIEKGSTLFFKVIQASSTRNTLPVGVTARSPAEIDIIDLPHDPFALVDRNECWIVKQLGELLNDGDIIAITYDDDNFKIRINGDEGQHLFHCEGLLDYWFFFDLNENVETIYFIGVVENELNLRI